MARKGYAEEQVAFAVRQAEAGTPVPEICDCFSGSSRVRHGYRRLHVLLGREGWSVNHKRIYRLYKLEGLAIRQKTPRRKRSSRFRGECLDATRPNQTWALDFMSDILFNGRRSAFLTVVDCHTRESLAIEPRASFGAYHVAELSPGACRSRINGWYSNGARPVKVVWSRC